MKKKLCSYTAFSGFLSLVVLLTLVTFVQAQNTEKWTGSVSFTLKLTTVTKDTSGNKKVVTSNETFAGTMNLYYDADPNVQSPTPGPDGCIIELLGSDGTKICFNENFGESTLTKKSGKGSVVFVGIGNIATTVQQQEVTGITYINGKGSLVQDSSKNLISIGLGGALGGGYPSEHGTIFSGTIPITTLTK
jgi:hypothetical protein